METAAAANLLEKLGAHMNPPEDRTYDRIIMTTRKRFTEEGFARITVGELCTDMRISKKTFYKFFKDKEDLVLAIMAAHFRIWYPKMLEILGDNCPPDDRLNNMMEFIINTVMRNITVVFLRDLQIMMPDVWDALNAFRMSQVTNIMNIIEEGRRTGLYRQDIDSEKLSKVLLLIVNRVVDPKLLYENGLQVGDVVNTFFNVLRYGVYENPKKKRGAR